MCAFRPVFRSYQPHDDELKELQMPKAKPVEGLYSVVWFYTVLLPIKKCLYLTVNLPNLN